MLLGYCNANDVSARDLQMRTSQWLLGKTLDGFCPLGPYLVTADEVADPQNLQTRSWLNGELRQNSNTADMVFTVAQIISYASQYMTLKPGDIILTGTPEGVILGMKDKVWMQPGDEVAVEVGDFGKLVNLLIAAVLGRSGASPGIQHPPTAYTHNARTPVLARTRAGGRFLRPWIEGTPMSSRR